MVAGSLIVFVLSLGFYVTPAVLGGGRVVMVATQITAIPSLLAVVAIIVVPVGWLFFLSFVGSDGQLSLQNYAKMIQYKSYARVFVTTFEVSLLTTLLCIMIGYPLAYFLAILPQRLAGFFMLAVLLIDELIFPSASAPILRRPRTYCSRETGFRLD